MRYWRDLVVLDCNTASAAALCRMQESWLRPHKRLLGVFITLIEALTERQWGSNSPLRQVAVQIMAFFATPVTVKSRAIGVDVEAQYWGGVVDAIEEGDLILAKALVRSHFDALNRKMPKPDAAILGCTHYPLLQEVFKSAISPDVRVFSQASLVSESLADYRKRHLQMRGAGEQSRTLTTGSPRQFSDNATWFLRRKLCLTLYNPQRDVYKRVAATGRFTLSL